MTERFLKIIILILLSALILYPYEMEIDIDLQMEIFIKMLYYEKKMTKRIDQNITFGIIYQEKVMASRSQKERITEFFQNSTKKSVKHLAIKHHSIPFASLTGLENDLKKLHIDILYITELRAVDIKEILRLCRKHRILSISGITDYIDEGVSASITLRKKRPLLVINLESVAAEGAEFSSNLLKISKVIR